MAVTDNQVRIEKNLRSSVPNVFKALAKGALFFNCGGDAESFVNDFRVGGEYRVVFANYGIRNAGKYLEIIPDRKIVFTWGDENADTNFPMSRVTIELHPDGDSTKLLLMHTGFATLEEAKDHDGGWNSGLTDFDHELTEGGLRLVRTFKVSRERLYAAFSDANTLAGIAKGGVEKSLPGERMVFTGHQGRIELKFGSKEGGSKLEILHSGLKTQDIAQSQRRSWNELTNRLQKQLS